VNDVSNNVGVDRGETALGLSWPCSSKKREKAPQPTPLTHPGQCLNTVHYIHAARPVAPRT